MKKKNNSASSIVISLLFGGVSGLLAVTLFMNLDDGWVMQLPLWTIPLFFLVAVFIQIAGHEMGHLLAGFSQKFRFHSINVAGITLDKEADKMKLSWNRAKGIGGFCLMLPSETSSSEKSFGVFLAGGIMMNALSALLGVYLLTQTSIVEQIPYVALFVLANTIIGALFAVTNAIPFRAGGFKSDGANLLSLIRQSPKDRAELKLVMMLYQISSGTNPLKMEEHHFKETTYLSDSDIYGITLNHYRLFRAYYQGELDAAKKYAKRIEANMESYPSIFQYKMIYQLLFYYACIERNEKLFNHHFISIEKQLKKDSSIEAERVRLLKAYMSHDLSTMRAHYQQMERLLPVAKVKGDAKMEIEIAKCFLSNVA